MKHLKRRFRDLMLFLLISSFFVFLVSGCGESEDAEVDMGPEDEVDLDAPIVTEGLPFSIPQYPTNQEEEAIFAARKIASEMPGEVTLRVLISPDNVGDFEPFYEEWERETGIKMETHTVPWPDWYRELVNISVTGTDLYDVFMMAPQWVPDLVGAGVLESFTPFLDEYEPEIFDPNSPNRLLPGLEGFGLYNGEYYFFLSDTDVATLYLREDWLNDPENQDGFENQYGYPLDIPNTLAEWRDQVEFFHNPAEDRYGMVMSWGDEEVLFDFIPRFLSQKTPFFDSDMNPNINSPEAVTALEEMIEMLQYSMPGTLEFDFARALEGFGDGRAYSALLMTWAQAAFEDPEFSQVVGNVTYAPYPGRIIDGELVSPQPQYWGWGYSVSAYSNNKELAYLYSQWMSGAAMNARVALTPGGWYDVCKVSNYDPDMYPEILQENGGMYSPDWMEVQKEQVEQLVPPLAAMRGGAEYTGVLVEAVSAVLSGTTEPQTALDSVATSWDEITERYGREQQIESWNSTKDLYSPAAAEWLGF